MLFRSGKLPFGEGDATLLRDDLNGFGEADILDFLYEGENVARLVATEAMVKLAHRMHRERRCFFPVKGAKTSVVLRSGFLQRDVSADDLNDVRLLLYELGEV